jgi:tetratricopeptide (TPR) repeat protein
VRALSNAARPAVALVTVSDKAGKTVKLGNGFFVSADGRLVTNAHVVEGAVTATAKLENGATYTIQGVLKSAADKDLVLLQADAKGVPFLNINEESLPEVGSQVAVIGSPLGLEGTVSDGIISGHRTLKKNDQWLQITAPVSPGSSGSPLIDEQGKVVGVATFVFDKAQALNFARPIVYVSQLLKEAGSDTEPAPLWTITADPKNVLLNDPEFAAADKALDQDNAAAALKILNGLAAKYPENESLLFKFGVAYEKLNLLDDAVQSYQHALKLQPTSGIAWRNLGLIFLKLHRQGDAKEAARQAVKVAPDLGSAWALLGAVYSEENRAADAVDALKKAAQFTPSDPDVWRALAAAYAKLNDPAAAKTADAKLATLAGANSPATAPQPSPSAGVTAKTPVSKEVYADAVTNTLGAFERSDVKSLLRKYDEKIVYRDYGIVGRDFIRRDLEKYFQRWPMTNVHLAGPIEVLDTPKPGEKVVRFKYDFRAASPDRRTFSVGTAWTVWNMSETSDGVKVWGEAQNVVRRPKH